MTTDHVAPPIGHLVQIAAGGDRPPVHCVHPASGSSFVYAGLARALGPGRPVLGFDAPGLDDGGDPVDDFHTLAAGYTAHLLADRPRSTGNPAAPQQPGFRLLGWSMGGMLAFEMARRLTAAGAEVAALIIIDAAVPERMPLPSERDILARFLADLIELAPFEAPGLDRILTEVPATVDPATAFARIERERILPEELEAEFLLERYRVFRAHIQAIFDHQADEPYDGDLVSIRASDSPAQHARWERVSRQVREHVLTGTHHSIWTGTSFVQLTGIVRAALDSVADR